MSALAAQSSQYVLIPREGSRLRDVSAQEVQSLIARHHDNDDSQREARMAELLLQRGVNGLNLRFVGDDVVVPGDCPQNVQQTIYDLLDKLPRMTAAADNDNTGNVVAFQPKEHFVGTAFAGAVNPLLKVADVGVHFKQASAYEAMTGNRLPRFGYRQSEGMHNRM